MERKILEQAFRQGMPMPSKIKNAPVLAMGLELFFNAWFELTSARSFGMGMGPIPWNIIQGYADRFELDDFQTEALHYHMGNMDMTYFKIQETKNKGGGNA